ncbi:MAG: hypothetical protein IT317_23270 [Anaerolineales bacterium]|nr:hypothetical protein [Anaerolineales bacterium]
MKLAHAPWRRWAALTILYALAAVVVTWPLAARLTTHLAGEAGGTSDTLEFVWSTWWWKRALLDLGHNPAWISVLQWPEGMRFPLLPLMAQSFVVALPLTALAGPVAAYNVVFLVSFVANGLAAYALCAELSGDRRAGFLAGLVWAFYPNLLGHALSGHLFQLVLFSFPLAALAWVRLLLAPSARRAVWAALVLGLASTVHPIYLAYFVLPWLAAALGVGVWQARRAYLTPARVRGVALALGLYALLLLPLAAPALLAAAQGQLAYLAPERGTVELSLDALSYLVPAPRQPLVALTPLAGFARAVVSRENETIGFVGWAPLALAVLGARRRPAASRVWLALGLGGALLALGPLLKLGGALALVPVEVEAFPLPLPYAWLARLPFFAWSRAPGRLSVLVALALAVLAALGYAALAPRWKRRPVAGLLAVLIVFEALVVWPFPLTPAARPGPVLALAAAPDARPALTLPRPDNDANLRALYWQTLHQHPLLGGRVYRDVPGGEDRANFLRQLLLTSADAADIVPTASAAARRAVLASDAGWVLYDAAADPDGSARAALVAALGAPQSEGDGTALFAAPPAPPPTGQTWALGAGWGPLQAAARRVAGAATVYVYSVEALAGALVLAAAPEAEPLGLHLTLNGAALPPVALGPGAAPLRLAAELRSGLNVLTITTVGLESDGAAPAALTALVSGLTWDTADEPAPLATFADVLALEAAAVPPMATAGARLPVTLTWRGLAPTPDDLHIFVHLLDAAGAAAAQHDGPPLGGAYPVARWVVGARVAEAVWVDLPADLPPGDYAVAVGVYRWPGLDRLPVSGSAQARDDRVIVSAVRVGP